MTLPSPSHDGALLLLAGPDTLYFSADLAVSDTIYAKLEREKEAAQLAAKANVVHCPDWLGARVLPHGDKGGYAFLVETDDFTVKICGRNTPHRPGLYIEMRSQALHTHAEGAAGACEEALCWVREQLCYDLDPTLVAQRVSVAAVKLSRADLHADWQGGYAPSLTSMSDDLHVLIRPGKVKWGLYGEGREPTGYTFGQGDVRARLYNKTIQARSRLDEGYFALLSACNGERFDPEQDVWRLEFQLRREGAKGFKLYAAPESGREADDEETDREVDAELAAEDLQHLGTLPRFFARMDQLWAYLTTHWLRLVQDNGSANRSRWPLHPTWQRLRDDFKTIAQADSLPEDKYQLVRGARYSGKSRLLRRMAVGVVGSIEVEDASPTAAALAALQEWAETAARKEAERAERRRARYLATYGHVPRWVERGMGERLARVEQVRHRVQMLLGIFAAHGVLPLELKPAHNVADLLMEHLDELEGEAEAKGGLPQLLADHFAKVYKVAVPREVFVPQPHVA